MLGGENMKPESISEKMMYNTVRLETESGMGTGFFYNFHVGDATYPTIITNKHVVNYKQDEKTTFRIGENLANETTDEGLISKTYKQLLQLKTRKTTQSKSGQRT